MNAAKEEHTTADRVSETIFTMLVETLLLREGDFSIGHVDPTFLDVNTNAGDRLIRRKGEGTMVILFVDPLTLTRAGIKSQTINALFDAIAHGAKNVTFVGSSCGKHALTDVLFGDGNSLVPKQHVGATYVLYVDASPPPHSPPPE